MKKKGTTFIEVLIAILWLSLGLLFCINLFLFIKMQNKKYLKKLEFSVNMMQEESFISNKLKSVKEVSSELPRKLNTKKSMKFEIIKESPFVVIKIKNGKKNYDEVILPENF